MTGRAGTRSVPRRAAALGAAAMLTAGGTVFVGTAAASPLECPQQSDGTFVCRITATGKTELAVPVAVNSFHIRLVGGTGGQGGGGGGTGGAGGITEGTVNFHVDKGDLLDVFVGENGRPGASCTGGDGKGGAGGTNDTGQDGARGGDAVCPSTNDVTGARFLRTATPTIGGGGGGGGATSLIPAALEIALPVAGGGGGGAGGSAGQAGPGGAGGMRDNGTTVDGANGLPQTISGGGPGGGGAVGNLGGFAGSNDADPGHNGATAGAGADGQCANTFGPPCDGGGGGGSGAASGGGGADGGGSESGAPGGGGGGSGCLLSCNGTPDVVTTFVGTSVPARAGGSSVGIAAEDPIAVLTFGTPGQGGRTGGTDGGTAPPPSHGKHSPVVKHHHHGNNNDPNPNTNPTQCSDPSRAPKACAPGRPPGH